jgi:ankyrin repeat protein
VIESSNSSFLKKSIPMSHLSAHERNHNQLLAAIETGELARVQYYVEEVGVDLNQLDSYGATVIGKAAMEGEEEIVQYLIEKGVNVNDVGLHDSTPLHKAAFIGNFSVVKLLIEAGALVDSEDKIMKETPLGLAVTRGNHEMIEYLVDQGADIHHLNKDGANMLHNAANDKALGNYLLDKGLSIHQVERFNNCRPLNIAADRGHKALVECLVEAGADINYPDKKGNTALHVAAYYRDERYKSIVDYLLSKGARWDQTNQKGETPLHMAAVASKSRSAIKLLLQAAGDQVKSYCYKMKDNYGKTAWELASKEIKEIMLSAIAKQAFALSEAQADQFLHPSYEGERQWCLLTQERLKIKEDSESTGLVKVPRELLDHINRYLFFSKEPTSPSMSANVLEQTMARIKV